MAQTFLTNADDFEDALADLIEEFEARGVSEARIIRALERKAADLETVTLIVTP